jgi:hypothetical protein
MKQKELKEAIFDMFRKSKETSSEPQAPKFKSIDSMLGGKMNLTAGDFAQLNPNTPADELKKAFRTAYLRGNIESQKSLKSLLDKEPYSELKDLVDQIDNAKLEKPMSKLGASDTQSVRRSSSGFPGLSEELLRMQKLAGIITEAEGRNLYTTAGQMISQVGLFTQELADELEAEGRGNLYRFFDTPEEKAELIKISEGYQAYLAKVKAMMDELMSDPMYQVAVGDAGRNTNPLEKAYMRAKNI